jgi:hypothetical protein
MKYNYTKYNNTMSISMKDFMSITGVNHNIVPPYFDLHGRTYYSVESFCKRHNVCDSFVRRQVKLVQNKNCTLWFIRILDRLWLTDSLLHLNFDNSKKISQIEGTWVAFLRGFNWDYFGTVRFSKKYSQKTVTGIVEAFVKRLTMKYFGLKTGLFYAVEQNPDNPRAFHFHFLLLVDTKDKTELKRFTESHFRGSKNTYGNTHMVKYDPNLGAASYILKQVHLLEDSCDIFTRNFD